MHKHLFITKLIFPEIIYRVVPIYFLIIAISVGLLISGSTAADLMITQQYYTQPDIKRLIYFVDAFAYTAKTAEDAISLEHSLEEHLLEMPNIETYYEQIMLISDDVDATIVAYPAELLNRLGIPDSTGGTLQTGNISNPRPLWIDHRLQGHYSVGDTLTLRVGSFYDALYPEEFIVAGYLNDENAHYQFMDGASKDSYSADIVYRNPSEHVMITTSDHLLTSPGYFHDRSAVKLLKIENDADYEQTVAQCVDIVEKEGLGQISTAEQIVENDWNIIRLQVIPMFGVCVALMILSFLSLGGVQMMLIEDMSGMYYALTVCGMRWYTWYRAWIGVFCFGVLLSSLAGCAVGSYAVSYFYWSEIRIPRLLPGIIACAITIFALISAILSTRHWRGTPNAL